MPFGLLDYALLLCALLPPVRKHGKYLRAALATWKRCVFAAAALLVGVWRLWDGAWAERVYQQLADASDALLRLDTPGSEISGLLVLSVRIALGGFVLGLVAGLVATGWRGWFTSLQFKWRVMAGLAVGGVVGSVGGLGIAGVIAVVGFASILWNPLVVAVTAVLLVGQVAAFHSLGRLDKALTPVYVVAAALDLALSLGVVAGLPPCFLAALGVGSVLHSIVDAARAIKPF